MMNKKKVAVLVLLVASILSFLYLTKPSNINLNDLYISSDEYDKIVKNKTISNNLDISSLKFDDYNLIQDNDNNLYYSLIEESSTRYNPTIEIDKDLSIAFVGNQITDDLIENNEHIIVIIYNSKQYKEYSLICTTLPVMTINTEENIGDDKVKGEMYLFDNREEATERQITSSSYFNIRGSATKKYPKHNYKISLVDDSLGGNERQRNINLLGLRLDDDYILTANYNDPEKVRDVFSVNLWKESCAIDNSFGIDAGYEYKYLELLVNGQYQGLYALGYKIDEKQLNLSENDVLYKNPNSIHGTFDYDAYFENGKLFRYEIVNSNIGEDKAWMIIKDYYKRILFTNETNFNELYESIDVNNEINVWLYVNLIQGVDNYYSSSKTIKNFYFLAKYQNDSYYFILIPWDLDVSWGKYHDIGLDNLYPGYNVDMDLNAAHYLCYLDENFCHEVKEKYRNLRSTYWSEEHLLELLNEYEKEIFNSGSFIRDLERWPDIDVYDYHVEPTAKLSYIKNYVIERLKCMDNFIESLNNE